MQRIVKFLDFHVDTQKHQLFQSGVRVDIASTAYKLLNYFIEHPGTTLSRQQLIDHVWSNRIVSDTSLDKLIQRLRKILGDTQTHKDIIGTVHGEGFVFLPEIKIENNQQSQQFDNRKTKNNRLKFFSFVVLPILLLVYFASTGDKNSSDVQLISQAEANPFTLSLIPDITTLEDMDQKWMTQGGMHYLNERFKSVMGLKSNRISLRKLANESPKRFAINLSNKELSDSSIIVRVKEKNQDFYADVNLRSKQAMTVNKSFQSATIKSLYDAIFIWALNELKLDTLKKTGSFTSTMSENRYAVENYIRGISAQVSGDAQQAIKYFELATNEDKNFWLAWYQLSVGYRRQGQYEKAMSIVKVFEKSQLDDKFMIMVLNSQVNIHNAMGDFEQGLETVNIAISLAKDINSISSQSILLSNKAYTASQLNKFQIAIDSIEESIQLTKQLDSNDNSGLGYSYSTLSGIYRDMNQLDLAENSANTAIQHLNKAGNKRYSAKIKLRLADILAKKGDWNKAEILLSDAALTLQDLNAILEESTAYLRLINIQLQNGEFARAENNYQRLSQLMPNISSKDQANSFLTITARLMLTTNNYIETENALKQLKTSSINDFHQLNYYLLALEYYKKINKKTKWLNTADELLTLKQFNDNPMIYLLQAQIAINGKNFELVEDAFEQAKSQVIKTNNVLMIANVLNPYINFLLEQNDLPHAQSNLLEIEKYHIPTYPYLKIKAKLVFAHGKIFEAVVLLEEAKSKSKDLWSVDDQLLLERYQLQLNNQTL